MPFDEENDDDDLIPKKSGVKKASSQKSIFDGQPKKPSQKDFDNKVKAAQERQTGYKASAFELSKKYVGYLKDKTLTQNKSVLVKQVEKETIGDMVQLAIEINNDPNEQEGMGSLSWITLLLKACLSQNNKINELEYKISLLEAKLKDQAL